MTNDRCSIPVGEPTVCSVSAFGIDPEVDWSSYKAGSRVNLPNREAKLSSPSTGE
jgi:hypothetical protein